MPSLAPEASVRMADDTSDFCAGVADGSDVRTSALPASPARKRRSGSGRKRRTQRTNGHPVASAPRWR